MIESLDKGIDLFAYFIEAAIFVWFFARVLTDKYPKFKAVTVPLCVIVLGILPFLLKSSAPIDLAANYFYNYLVLLVLLLVMVIFLKAGSLDEKIFWIVNGLTAFVLTGMLSTTTFVAVRQGLAAQSQTSAAVALVLIFTVCKLLQIGLLLLLSTEKTVIRIFNKRMIYLYALTSIAMSFLATRSVVLLITAKRTVTANDFVVPIALMIIGLCFLANIKFLSKEMETAYLAKLELAGAKLSKEHLKETEALYSDIKGLNHNLANHLSILYGLAKKGDCAGSMDYIRTLNGHITAPKSTVFTGNSTIDIIINAKRTIADAAGIDCRVDSDLEGEIRITAVDLAIILGNLLDNAIGGCSSVPEGKFIDLKLKTANGALHINVKNSFKASTESKSKKLVLGESTGLSQIQRAAESYGGYLLITGGDTEFSVQVNIPMLSAAN